MWRSVFLHEFLDTNIRNFKALAGMPTPASLTLTPVQSPLLQTNVVSITPGRGFKYSLAEPLDQVIGISGSVRIQYPLPVTFMHPVPILQVGDIAEFKVLPDPDIIDPESGESGTSVRGLLYIRQTEIDLGTVTFSRDRFTNIKFNWHTSGQARLLQDGKLVGYQNAVMPGVLFSVADVAFGMLDPPIEPINYEIGRVFVRVLRRPDSLTNFSKLLPDIPIPDELFRPCYLQTINHLLAMVDRLRQFMSLIHQKLSQPWTLVSGPAEGPFSPEAIAAHELAIKAVVELAKMIRTGDFSAADAFLDLFENFLRILHDTLPDEFAALAEELTQTLDLPAECISLSESMLEENRQALDPLLDVLSKASDRVRDIVGGF